MKVVLAPGDRLDIEFEKTEHMFTVKSTAREIQMCVNMPDDSKRDGEIYYENFGTVFDEARSMAENVIALSITRDYITTYVLNEVVKHVNREHYKDVKPETRFRDLGIDSLDMHDLLIPIEENYGEIFESEFETVGDLIDAVFKMVEKK